MVQILFACALATLALWHGRRGDRGTVEEQVVVVPEWAVRSLGAADAFALARREKEIVCEQRAELAGTLAVVARRLGASPVRRVLTVGSGARRQLLVSFEDGSELRLAEIDSTADAVAAEVAAPRRLADLDVEGAEAVVVLDAPCGRIEVRGRDLDVRLS